MLTPGAKRKISNGKLSPKWDNFSLTKEAHRFKVMKMYLFFFLLLCLLPSCNTLIFFFFFLLQQAMQLQSLKLLVSEALFSLKGHRSFHLLRACMDEILCRIQLLWSLMDYWPDRDFHGSRSESIFLWGEILARGSLKTC